MAVLNGIRFVIDSLAEEEVPVADLSHSLMWVILHLYSGFAGFYLQIYHEDCKRMLERINALFRSRSSRGEYCVYGRV